MPNERTTVAEILSTGLLRKKRRDSLKTIVVHPGPWVRLCVNSMASEIPALLENANDLLLRYAYDQQVDPFGLQTLLDIIDGVLLSRAGVAVLQKH